uniref:Uncharacterized protein n=1 Tax=Rhizophora mucronata TaxID=61149 RepID=A0A2P2QNM0_RHIMU
MKQEAGKENDRIKRQGKKSAPETGPVSPSAAVVDAPKVDKENVVALPTEEINLTEVM